MRIEIFSSVIVTIFFIVVAESIGYLNAILIYNLAILIYLFIKN